MKNQKKLWEKIQLHKNSLNQLNSTYFLFFLFTIFNGFFAILHPFLLCNFNKLFLIIKQEKNKKVMRKNWKVKFSPKLALEVIQRNFSANFEQKKLWEKIEIPKSVNLWGFYGFFLFVHIAQLSFWYISLFCAYCLTKCNSHAIIEA
jgi:hypothetical protein